MKIVIDIPDRIHYDIEKGITVNGSIASKRILDCVKNGTPLPKGHGRLIDADVVDDNIYDLTRSIDLNYGQISEVVDAAPTIIEADKGEE